MRSVLAGLRTLVLPWGAPAGTPRQVQGPDIPPELTSYSPDFTWHTVTLWYYGTNYRFEALATNTAFGVAEYVTGTVVAGVVRLYTFEDASGSDFPAMKVGSDNYFPAGERLKVRYRRTDVMLTTTATLQVEDPTLSNGTAETWHDIPFSNLWVNSGAGQASFQCRKIASPPDSVQIMGRITTASANNTNGIAVGTVPAAYRPTSAQQFFADNWANINVIPCSVEIDGSVKLWGTFGKDISISGIYTLNKPAA